MMSCQRCKKTTNGPLAFLLTCRGCSRTWHHRCHMPPVEDGELIQRIRATNSGDKDNGLVSWTCRRCKKVAPATSTVAFSPGPTASSSNQERSTAVNATSTRTSCVEVRVKQDQEPVWGHSQLEKNSLNVQQVTGVDAQPLTESKKDVEEQVQRVPSSAPKPPHVQVQIGPTEPRSADVEMGEITPTKLTSASQASSQVVTTSSDVDMRVDALPPATSNATFQGPSPGNRATSVAQVPTPVRDESLTSERHMELVDQSQVDQGAEDDDDPEDLYGPPVPRRIIRILPSFTEELLEQQRRASAEKENRRAPLAPDWILARHVHDPLWREVRPTVGHRKRRKPTARMLGNNGLDVDELLGYLTFQDCVQEHIET